MGDIQRQGRRRRGIAAAIGGAAGVLDFETEAGIARTRLAGGRREHEFAGHDVGRKNALPCCHRNAVVGQRARLRQRCHDHRRQAVGRNVVRIGEAEVGDLEGVGGVLQQVQRR